MQVIDFSPIRWKQEGISLSERLQGTLKYGLHWYNDLEAQALVVRHLNRHLNNQHVLFQHYSIPKATMVAPLLLVGPAGIYTCLLTSLSGVYRAKNESWLVQDPSKGYNPAQPNLLAQVAQLAQAIQEYLKGSQVPIPPVQPVLICTNPKMFVETVRPVARVISSDALELFSSGLAQDRTALDTASLKVIVDYLTAPPPVEEPVPSPTPSTPRQPGSTINLPSFSTRQMITLGVLAGLLVIVLIALIFIVLLA